MKATDVINGTLFNVYRSWYSMVTSVLFRKENAVMCEYVNDYGETGYACLSFDKNGEFSHSVTSSSKDIEDFNEIKIHFDFAE